MRKPTTLCAGTCGRLIFTGKGSLPPGRAMCRPCRRLKPTYLPPPRPRPFKDCDVCGKRFKPRDHRSRFCCESCVGLERQGPTLSCARCGGVFIATRNSRGAEFCSWSCAHPSVEPAGECGLAWASCVQCRVVFMARGGRRRCDSCPRLSRYTPALLTPRRCPNCGWLFNPEPTGGKLRRFCSARCTQRFQHRRRRAHEAGVMMAPIDELRIYQRDGFICQLCMEPVDVTLPTQHKWAATIDHITPISKGGPDTPANVQLAHRGCNSRKGNRVVELEGVG